MAAPIDTAPGDEIDDHIAGALGQRQERFAAAPHSRPMLSLQNSYDLEEVEA